MLPPGRARLVTSPVATGSPAGAKTIGMTDVARCAAMAGGVPAVTMTSTLCRTNSAAISAKRSSRPSAQSASIATVRPSIQPSSPSRCTKAATRWLSTEGVVAPKSPMVGNLAACCARAVSGQAAVPPTNVMKSRRRIAFTEAGTTPNRTQLQQGFATGEMGFSQFARQQSLGPNVRFGSKADIAERWTDVRFTPKSGHWNSVA